MEPSRVALLIHSAVSTASMSLWMWLPWYIAGDAKEKPSVRILLAIALTSALGITLAFVGLFTSLAIWSLLTTLAVIRFVRARAASRLGKPELGSGMRLPEAIIATVVVFILWPSLVRPPTDGDTLIYHLPNAALWLNTHSLWHTNTRLWWYPEGSEFFAATAIGASGIGAIPLVGAISLFALGLNLYAVGVTRAKSRVLAIGLTLSIVTCNLVAVQGGDLQNDVLLSALLCAVAFENVAWPWNFLLIGMASFVKPSGWLYAAASVVARREIRNLSRLLAIVAVTSVWWTRNSILSATAIHVLPGANASKLLSTSILFHGIAGFVTLARSCLTDSVTTLALLVCGLIGCFYPTSQRSLLVGSFLIWIVSPYTFESGGIAQLASGAALRFGLPFFCVSTIFVCEIFGRLASGRYTRLKISIGSALTLLSVVKLWHFRTIYVNDESTSFQVLAGLIVLGVLLSGFIIGSARSERAFVRMSNVVIMPACLIALLAYGLFLRESANVVNYYRDELKTARGPSIIPDILFENANVNVIVDGFPPGIANVLRPHATVTELPDGADACTFVESLQTAAVIRSAMRPASGACPSRRVGDAALIAPHPGF